MALPASVAPQAAMKPSLLPPITYGLSRNVAWPWLAPAVYAVAFLSFVVLIILNVALTAYETVVVTTSSFNDTRTVWYHRLIGAPAPGSQCSSYNLTVGQAFKTTNSLLDYTLLSIEGKRQTISYSALPLYDCDVIDMVADTDVGATTVTLIAYVACTSNELPIVAKTTYVFSQLPSIQDDGAVSSPAQRMFQTNNSALTPPDNISFVRIHDLNRLTALCQNLHDIVQTLSQWSTPFPERISVQGIPSCSKNPFYKKYVAAYCDNNDDDPVTILYGGRALGYMGFANGTRISAGDGGNATFGKYWVDVDDTYDSPPTKYSAVYLPGITNAMQGLIAAVRLDFGLILPNNPYLDMSVMNTTLQDPYPVGMDGHWASTIESGIAYPENPQTYGMDVFNSNQDAYLAAEYVCRFVQPLSWAQAAVNVMVATLSLFSTGWGLAMAVIAFFAQRKPEDNYCEAHVSANIPLSEKSSEAKV